MKSKSFGYMLIVMASIIIILAGIKSASAIIVPFLLSLFIAIILSPAYNFLQKKLFLPSAIALLVVVVVFITCLGAIATLIGNSIHSFSANIDTYTQQLDSYYIVVSAFLKDYGISIPTQEISSFFNTKQTMLFISSMVKSMSSLFTNGFVILLSVVFMLLETKSFDTKIAMLENSDAQEHIGKIIAKIKEYMMLKALISLVTAVIVWIALVSIGADYPFLWAVLAFLFNFIPNIGSIIAAIPAVLVTLVQLGSGYALVVALLYIAINVIIGSIIEPRVMGKGLGLSTLVVFLSLLFWGWLLGMVGMLLSIPLTIMFKIVLHENKNTRWISTLLGS